MSTTERFSPDRPALSIGWRAVLGWLAAGTVIAASACGSPTASTGGNPPASNSGGGGTPSLSAATVIHVVVTGGAVAGTYDAQSGDATCTRTSADKTYFGNQYTDLSNGSLSSLQLIVQDAAAFTGSGTLFTTDITIKGQDLSIDNLPNHDPQGSGTVAIKDSGANATVTIKGQASDGSTIDATIQCNKVTSLG